MMSLDDFKGVKRTPNQSGFDMLAEVLEAVQGAETLMKLQFARNSRLNVQENPRPINSTSFVKYPFFENVCKKPRTVRPSKQERLMREKAMKKPITHQPLGVSMADRVILKKPAAMYEICSEPSRPLKLKIRKIRNTDTCLNPSPELPLGFKNCIQSMRGSDLRCVDKWAERGCYLAVV